MGFIRSLRRRSIAGRLSAGLPLPGAMFLLAACGTSYPASQPAASPPSSSSSSAAASSGAGSADFSKALAAWKAAGSADAATMNTYLQQAAFDLKVAGNPRYSTAISELEDLISLPSTNLSSAQQAQAHADERKLDSFFGTPGLNM